MVIGLTGPSGAGKTELTKVFEENGFITVNLDKTVHELYENNEEAIEVIKKINKNIIENKKINRKKLAQIVFSNKEQLKKFNNTILPLVYKKVEKILIQNKGKFIILDAPTLFESGIDKLCDYTIALLSSRKKRVQRLNKREIANEELIKKRIKCEKSNIYYIIKANNIIINNKDTEKLRKKAIQYIRKIKKV